MPRSRREESTPKGGHPPSRSHPAASGLPSPQGLCPSAYGLTPYRAAPSALKTTKPGASAWNSLFRPIYAALCPKGLRPSGLPGIQSALPPQPFSKGSGALKAQGLTPRKRRVKQRLRPTRAPQVSMKSRRGCQSSLQWHPHCITM